MNVSVVKRKDKQKGRMKRTIAKNTLSFSTSKSMMYLRTPVDIWDSISKEFDFTLDACASDENHLLPKYYTKENSCLNHDWSNEVVYLHPMFDMHIGKFVEKAYNENINNNVKVVMLIPASTHTRYFHKYLYTNPRVEIMFLEKQSLILLLLFTFHFCQALSNF